MKRYHTPELLIDTANFAAIMAGDDTGLDMSGEIGLPLDLEE